MGAQHSFKQGSKMIPSEFQNNLAAEFPGMAGIAGGFPRPLLPFPSVLEDPDVAGHMDTQNRNHTLWTLQVRCGHMSPFWPGGG